MTFKGKIRKMSAQREKKKNRKEYSLVLFLIVENERFPLNILKREKVQVLLNSNKYIRLQLFDKTGE